ncbi:polyribonucleotide nucleotidyltransferase [Phosphitispora fastidiosa]|uniref:polyribonucleotide nucleotidyltransferase n=1 Tax=Phosphitispora fastidiosa TaxID=2837202 RepID=UPI001E396C3A|nr:polyribonucleotide nucleotidyltransferase [Phosphitispora fastidiosa]MBU7005582.1 polyribonucleotide nucleotidyltransferase [Phosphitispora fastidiosa]
MTQQSSGIIRSLPVGGREMSIETGRLAKQASGAALVRYGDTVVLVTATRSEEPREGTDFFPLTVDYEERLYAVGRIPGGFIKREGRPSERAILADRLIDRPIRPLFPKGYRNDVHVVATILSVDQDNPQDVTALTGASAALTLSDIPFQGPIAAVVVGRIDGKFIINPTLAQSEVSEMHITVAGTRDAVTMVEAGAKEVPEDVMLDAIMYGHEEIKKIVEFISEFREIALREGYAKPDYDYNVFAVPEEIETEVRAYALPKVEAAVRECIEKKLAKQAREKFLKGLKEEVKQYFAEKYPEEDRAKYVGNAMDKLEKEAMRRSILEDRIRIDGRALDEVRQITCEVSVLPRTHGTGLFTRGQTQILSVITLGAVGDEQILDGLGVEDSKRYMHHYNFPPYSVGEARFMRGPGRREIGHGALAERALEPMIPPEEDFPYTIRIVSEALESNGSTSMGSVCGSTLSLMDAGVPIKSPVSGVAMGLIKEEDKFAVLTDIQGMEDHLGDMDFKVAGTEKGITAIQMDIKIAGINRDILKEALEQARKGRMYILQKMLDVISEPRPDLSPYAPRIITTTIDPDKIRNVIGPGGKTIKKIIDETGVKIDIEDDGRVFIAAVDGEAGKKALEIIESLTADVEIGKIYLGKVVKITDFGAFVEVLPGKEGLVHISQLAEQRVGKVEDVVSVGDEIMVKVIKIDEHGRVNLSRKEALRAQTAEK